MRTGGGRAAREMPDLGVVGEGGHRGGPEEASQEAGAREEVEPRVEHRC